MTCFSKKCVWHDMCKLPYDIGGCSHYQEKRPQTNEEWFYSLSTEEKAKTIICLAVNSMHKKRKGLIENDVNEIMRWLKEKHND